MTIDGKFDEGDDTGHAAIDATLDHFAAANRDNPKVTAALERAAAEIKATPDTFIDEGGGMRRGAFEALVARELSGTGAVVPPARAHEMSLLGAIAGQDIEAMCFIVLMAAAQSAREDLKSIMDQVKHQTDSMSEMGEMESLRMQMSMDRLSKLMTTLSNILKQMSDTAATITGNLK